MPAPYEVPTHPSTPSNTLAQNERSIHPTYRPMLRPGRVRISALFYPAPNITNEQFRKYWLEEHGKIFMSLPIVRKNLTKYEQYHFDLDMNDKLSAAMGTVPSPFWGLAIFEAESYDKIVEVLSHPEYQRRVFPDERIILDRSKSLILSGEFATIFEPERARL